VALLAPPRCGREDNIKMDLKKEDESEDWINLAQGTNNCEMLRTL
jgi:hypothetical protein